MTASATHDVLVIVPSRSRPANSIVFAETFLAHSTRSDLLFALDEDDPLFPAYAGIAGVQYELNPRLRLVGTLNLLANTYLDQYTYLAFMGDDHRIRTPGWDQRLVEAIGDVPHGIAYGNDLLPGDPLPSAVLLNASIVRSLGYIAPPDLIHHGTATFWHDLGQALGTLRYREDVIIEHQPVSAGTTAPDELFAETHAPDAVARDLAAYQRYAQHRFKRDVAALRVLSQRPTVDRVSSTRAERAGVLRTDFSGFTDLPIRGTVPLLETGSNDGGQLSLPLLWGPVRPLAPMSGFSGDSWVSGEMEMRVIADQALETLTISGRMPWGVGKEAPLLARLNGTLHAASFNEGEPVTWAIPCVVPTSGDLHIELQPGRVAHVPWPGESGQRALGFLLTRLAFQSSPPTSWAERGMFDNSSTYHRYAADIEGVQSAEQIPTASISLLCATRDRPEGVLRFVVSALKTAQCPQSLEFVFYLDDDDDTFPSLADLGANCRIVRGPRVIMSHMWNYCASAATGHYLAFMADDFEFRTPGWDLLVREEIERWPDGIVLVHGDDLSGYSHLLATHFFLTRRWVETVGYLTPPYFSCDYLDVWVTEVADELGRRRYIPDIAIEHHHPVWGKAELDRSHRERMARGERDDVATLFHSLGVLREVDVAKLASVLGTRWSGDRSARTGGDADHEEASRAAAMASSDEHTANAARDAGVRLSILIAHHPEDAGLLTRLLGVLQPQVNAANGKVEILVHAVEGPSMAAEHMALVEQASGDYVAFVDVRDMVASDYVSRILAAIESSPDVVAIEVASASGLRTLRSFQSELQSEVRSGSVITRCRNLDLVNPIRRTAVLASGFRNYGKGTKCKYAKELKSLVHTQSIIPGPIYIDLRH